MARERRVRLVDAVGARRVDKVQLAQPVDVDVDRHDARGATGRIERHRRVLEQRHGVGRRQHALLAVLPAEQCVDKCAFARVEFTHNAREEERFQRREALAQHGSLVVRRVELDQRVLQPLERLTLPRFDGSLRVGEQRVARNGAEAAARERERGAQAGETCPESDLAV